MNSSQGNGSRPAMSEIPVADVYSSGGYPPGAYVSAPPAGTYDLNRPQDDQPSTADVAKSQASDLAEGTRDAAQHVAGVAKEQVGQITAEATRQVKDLLGQAQSEISGQAQVQQQRLAGGLHAVGDQLKSMAQGTEERGMVTDLTHQAAGKAHEIATWFESRDPGLVLDEVRSFASRRPGVFLAAALGAGLLVGRLARGLAADPDETDRGTKPATAIPDYRPAELSDGR